MANKELLEKIARLETELAEVKEMAEAMKKKADGSGVFKPKYGESYWNIENDGEVYPEVWENFHFDKNIYSIGNCFPTEQAAKDTVRALKLIQKAKESQNGFVPDWEDWIQSKHRLYFDSECKEVRIMSSQLLNPDPTLGYWKDELECERFIRDNYNELIWYFTKYRR